MNDVRERLTANRRQLIGFFSAQRAEECLALDACLLSRHHCLLLGPPGEAKSLLARTWASALRGAEYREVLCTRQSTEQDLFYYLDVPAFTKGRHVYKYDGKVSEGHVVFLDECFKLTGGTLNAGLGLLNERIAPGGYRSPLVTAIGASNEMGEDDSVAALEDRWLARFWVDTLDDAHFDAFLRGRVGGASPPTLQPIALDDVEAAQAAARALPVDDEVVDALVKLRRALAGSGITVSPRRGGWCVEYLRAIAWLDGADEVMIDHLNALRHVLWRRPEERPIVEAAIGQIDRGVVGEIRALADQVLGPYYADRARLTELEFGEQSARHMEALVRTAEQIKERFGDRVSGRVRERTTAYMDELRQAFRDAKSAHEAWTHTEMT